MTKYTQIFALALPLAAVLTAGCNSGGGTTKAEAKPPLPTVQVADVTRGTLEKALPVTGVLQALPGRRATLSPPVAGVLSGLFVRYGQNVSAGQVIAQLSTNQLAGQIEQAKATIGQTQVQVRQAQANALQQQAQSQSAILQAQASLKNAEAALAGARATLLGSDAAVVNARQSLSRIQTLFSEGLVPQKDVQTAKLTLRTAEASAAAQRQAVAGQQQTVAGQQAAVSAARAASLQNEVKRQDVLVARQQLKNAQGALVTAQAQKALYTLRAPLAGQVSAVGASVGETVDMTTKIAVIANLSLLQLNIGLPGDAAASVRPGQALTFTVNSLPGRVFRATVQSVAQSADPATGTVPALALVPNSGFLLRDAATARVQIVVERRQGVLIVPRAAVLSDPDTGKDTVATADGGTVHLVPVTTGLSVGDRVEIRSGLTGGEQVAVSGQYGLPDGAKVQIAKAQVQHGQ